MHPGGLVPYDMGSPKRRVIVRRTSLDGIDVSSMNWRSCASFQSGAITTSWELTATAVEGGYLSIVTCYHPLTPGLYTSSLQAVQTDATGAAQHIYLASPSLLQETTAEA